MADLPNCLGRQRNNAGDTRRANASGELQKRYRPQNNSYLLHAAAEQRSQLVLVLLFASSGESVGDLSASISLLPEEAAELPAGGFKGSLLVFAAVI